MQPHFKITKRLSGFLFIVLLITAVPALSQTACPIGVAPGSPQCGPSAPPASNAQGAAPLPQAVPTGKWLSRYGAIAVADNGDTGISSLKQSRREAEQEAVRQCRTWGSPGCKTIFWYDNACVASASRLEGSTQRSITRTSRGDTIEAASSEALSGCREVNNGAECKINFAECSKPVFVSY